VIQWCEVTFLEFRDNDSVSDWGTMLSAYGGAISCRSRWGSSLSLSSKLQLHILRRIDTPRPGAALGHLRGIRDLTIAANSVFISRIAGPRHHRLPGDAALSFALSRTPTHQHQQRRAYKYLASRDDDAATAGGKNAIAEQRKSDWRIVKKLMGHVWPRGDWKTKGTVLFGFGLLVGGKVRLLSFSLRPSLCLDACIQCLVPMTRWNWGREQKLIGVPLVAAGFERTSTTAVQERD
jgi:hypothetical protein